MWCIVEYEYLTLIGKCHRLSSDIYSSQTISPINDQVPSLFPPLSLPFLLPFEPAHSLNAHTHFLSLHT